jgi:hypothetical protein
MSKSEHSEDKKRSKDEKIQRNNAPIHREGPEEEFSSGTVSSMEMTGIAPAAIPVNLGMPSFNQLWTNPTEMLGAEPEEDDERNIHREKSEKKKR